MSTASVRVIGVDCAVDDSRVGLASGQWDGSEMRVLEVAPGRSGVEDIIVNWMGGRPAVLALDAPLGWPILMGRELAVHRAGDPIGTPPNSLFRRETDRRVYELTGRQPLDVGADRIGRTAHAALKLVASIRRRTGQPLPLLWAPSEAASGGVIEVYPAGTLTSLGALASGYKKSADPDHLAGRRRILTELERQLILDVDPLPMIQNADVLDAVICLLAAADFLSGRAHAPSEPGQFEQEGWIWLRPPVTP
jgi:hypothetical protein